MVKSVEDDHHLKVKFDGSIELSGSDEQNIVSDGNEDRLPFRGVINDVENDDAMSHSDTDIMSENVTEVRTANNSENQDFSISDGSAENAGMVRENGDFPEPVRIEDSDTLEDNNREFSNNYGSVEKSSSEENSDGLLKTLRAESNETSDSVEFQLHDVSAENTVSNKEHNYIPISLKIGVNDIQAKIYDGRLKNLALEAEKIKKTSDISVAQGNGMGKPTSDKYFELFGNEDNQKDVNNPAFIPTDSLIDLTTRATGPKATKFKRHKVKDDERIRKFTAHVYEQALKVFESMKKKTDPYTATKIDSLAETYKTKFTDFVKRTRNVDIKTRQGTQNVILHTIDTSNLILERIVNFLKTDMLGEGTSALRQGGASRLQKEVDTVKSLEHDHACKMFGICHSVNGFRDKLQSIITTLLYLPDEKLLQANDAATEILKHAELSAFISSYTTIHRVDKAIRSLEKTDADTLRKYLEILFSVLSQSHLPLIVDTAKAVEKHSVKRTVSFHGLLDALEDALPPTEANKAEWGEILNRLKIWKDGGVSDVQETFQMLFNNVNRGAQMYRNKSEKIRELAEDVAECVVGDDDDDDE